MISLLFDISPPVKPGGTVGLGLLTVVIISLVAVLLFGFVMLLKFLKRRRNRVELYPAQQSAVPHNQP
jgi:hypothetical protein